MATPPDTVLRSVTPDDVPRASQLLADAFGDYVWTRWTVAADDHARRLRELYSTFLTAVALPYGVVDGADIADAGLGAVAVWTRAGAVPDTVRERVGAVAAELTGDRAAAAEAADTALAPQRPTIPHVSLDALGVDPRQQGRGLGSALLRAGLRAVDRAGLPAYLETSEPRNVRLYERHGFVVTAVVDLEGGGPRTWSMLRPPASGS